MGLLSSFFAAAQLTVFTVLALATIVWLALFFVYPEVSFVCLCAATAISAFFAGVNFNQVQRLQTAVTNLREVDEKFEEGLTSLQQRVLNNREAVQDLQNQNHELYHERKRLASKLESLEKFQESVKVLGDLNEECLSQIKERKSKVSQLWMRQVYISERCVILTAYKQLLHTYCGPNGEDRNGELKLTLNEFREIFKVLPPVYHSAWKRMGGRETWKKAAGEDRMIDIKELGTIMSQWVNSIVELKLVEGFDF